MEQESDVSKARRRARTLRNFAIEVFLAALFVGAIIFGDGFAKDAKTSVAAKAFAVVLPLSVLTAWWLYYARLITALGEFERVIAIRSLAISCGVTLWITTAWGLAVAFAGAPSIPLAMIAPVAAVIYGVTRAIFQFAYR